MFVQVTPINEITGITNGNPIFIGHDKIVYLQRKSATADHVDYTFIEIMDSVGLFCSETPEQILPMVYGAGVRS